MYIFSYLHISYQSPEFYKRMGYEVFAVNDEYPEDIKQFLLKKKL
ncbi:MULTISPECIES: hypothetical protein [Heyndrickxia]|nr:hypothetical protein [Heyndrickxia oleronia]GIN39384.1 hypothetical protein J19TS1_23330 [Heyndrickxia oleronia]